MDLIPNITRITNSTRIKSCKKNLLANFCLNYSNHVKTIINWNKLKLKKRQYQKLQQKNPEDAVIGYSSVLDVLSHNAL